MAARLLESLAQSLEDAANGFLLAHGATQRLEGVDAVEVDGRLLDVGALEGLHMVVEGFINRNNFV